VQNYGSFFFEIVFKATISLKDTSFWGACRCQEELGPQRRGVEATSGENAQARRYSRETS